MKKNFRLQKVLEYRERIVDIEKNKLSAMNAKLADTNAKVKAAEDEIAKQVEDKQTAENMFRSMYDKYIAKLTGQKNALVKQKRQLELNIGIHKKKVMEAIERHKIILKLKEKHVENFRQYLNKEEMKLIDELAVTRSGKNEN
ncbi:MAG: hypothetical protein C0602_07360 [Denitrovibrio sp.]|nr:MAG: hypothetical protein C0602_07360 [Denitrovibrio sp.]